METVQYILNEAANLGACQESGKATDWKSLCWLFFSPQGREFCRDNNYPPLEMFRSMKPHIRPYCVYVEENVIRRNEDIALIGESNSELSFSGVDKVYKVILMHGAKAVIKAACYAVVLIENISGEYQIINDGTSEVLL